MKIHHSQKYPLCPHSKFGSTPHAGSMHDCNKILLGSHSVDLYSYMENGIW